MACGNSNYKQGEIIYKSKCAHCHMEDGSGLGNLIPSLSIEQFKQGPKTAICKIISGYNTEEFGNAMRVMPSFETLSDVEMANLINYLNYKWGQKKIHYNIAEITDWTQQCKNNLLSN